MGIGGQKIRGSSCHGRRRKREQKMQLDEREKNGRGKREKKKKKRKLVYLIQGSPETQNFVLYIQTRNIHIFSVSIQMFMVRLDQLSAGFYNCFVPTIMVCVICFTEAGKKINALGCFLR